MPHEDVDEPLPAENDGPFVLTVDGELFTVRRRPGEPNTIDYTWESGPNSGYGYSSTLTAAFPSIQDRANCPSVFPPLSIDEHRESIRDFLGQINPDTGYMGD
ncbi:hypothetical protein [Rhodococcus sp. 077-4]|uniref:hypothetical protein n=1 Tax=Rhodococcus sp. 077-4 TaxID=2789271 RepID=UPI0039F52412